MSTYYSLRLLGEWEVRSVWVIWINVNAIISILKIIHILIITWTSNIFNKKITPSLCDIITTRLTRDTTTFFVLVSLSSFSSSIGTFFSQVPHLPKFHTKPVVFLNCLSVLCKKSLEKGKSETLWPLKVVCWSRKS